MAFSITPIGSVQDTVNDSSAVLTTTQDVPDGASIVVQCIQGAGRAVVLVTDSVDNPYVRAVDSSGNAIVETWHCLNPDPLPSGSQITITWNGSDSRKNVLAYHLGATSELVTTGEAAGDSATPSATTAGPVGIGQAVFAAISTNGTATLTQPAGWAEDYNGNNNSRLQSAVRQITTSAGAVTYNPTLSTSRRWDIVLAAYRSSALTGNVGQASEVDTATPLTRDRAYTAGLASETDSALAILRHRSVPVGQPSETDTGFSLAYDRGIAVGQAVETDTARALAPAGVSSEVEQASESDVAQSVTPIRIRTIGLAEETDSAHDARLQRMVAIGLAAEASTAHALAGFSRGATIGLPSETDTATGISWAKVKAIGSAAEADTARPITFSLVSGYTQAPAHRRATVKAESRTIAA